MSGAVDAIADIGLGDIIDFPVDLGSITDIAGTEFMSSLDISSFEIPSFEIPSLGGFDVAGSFAGSASWFDTFNPGSILDSIPGVSDFSLPSLPGLPSLASLNTNNLVSSAASSLGISPSITSSITNALNNPSLISAGAAALGINPAIATSAAKVLSGGSPVAAGASALGINPAIATSLTAKATSLFTTDPTSANAKDVATGLPINTPREVDAYGLSILTDAESTALTKNATLVNSLVDPNTGPTTPSYDTAVATNRSLSEQVANLDDEIVGANARIASEKERLAAATTQLDNPNLSEAERTALQTEADTANRLISQYTTEKEAFQQEFDSASDALAKNNQVIAQTDASAIRAPDAGEDPYVSNGQSTIPSASDIKTSPDAVNLGGVTAADLALATGVNLGGVTGADLALATDPGLVVAARAQQSIRELRNNKAQSSDWRVRLRLAPNSTYLYNDTANIGVLAALKATDGVIFPYTPSIETAYKANYDQYDLTHSNYRGYFYKNSYVDAVNVRATFTAQDTKEADYLLAVIHFFRSVTKMFYGQDQQRGSPPPLVYLSGYGDYQFNEHPCVVSQFNYTLPPDVDYIRAQNNLQSNTNQSINRLKNPIANNPVAYSVNRLLNSSLLAGALTTRPAQTNNLANNQPTYVPTKMEIAITLLPIQSRSNISNNFSVRGFANGNLLKGGYW